jgi:hypothetical protein
MKQVPMQFRAWQKWLLLICYPSTVTYISEHIFWNTTLLFLRNKQHYSPKVSRSVTKYTRRKVKKGEAVSLHTVTALDVSERCASRSGIFTTEERPWQPLNSHRRGDPKFRRRNMSDVLL